MRFLIAVLGSGLSMIFLYGAIASATAGEEWTLEKHESGIDVYTRSVAGSGIKEVKGIVQVDVALESVLALLMDSDQFKTWFPNTPESKLLERKGDISYHYAVSSTPWPLSDRDNVLRWETKRDDGTGVVDIVMTAAPAYHPAQKGRIRIQKAKGLWKLELVGTDKTRITFRMHLEPGGGIPQWLINARIVATPFGALANLRSKVEQ